MSEVKELYEVLTRGDARRLEENYAREFRNEIHFIAETIVREDSRPSITVEDIKEAVERYHQETS